MTPLLIEKTSDGSFSTTLVWFSPLFPTPWRVMSRRFFKSTSPHARKPQLWADQFKAAEHRRPEGSRVRAWAENSWREIRGNRWIHDAHVEWITTANAKASVLSVSGLHTECCCAGQHHGQLPHASSESGLFCNLSSIHYLFHPFNIIIPFCYVPIYF